MNSTFHRFHWFKEFAELLTQRRTSFHLFHGIQEIPWPSLTNTRLISWISWNSWNSMVLCQWHTPNFRDYMDFTELMKFIGPPTQTHLFTDFMGFTEFMKFMGLPSHTPDFSDFTDFTEFLEFLRHPSHFTDLTEFMEFMGPSSHTLHFTNFTVFLGPLWHTSFHRFPGIHGIPKHSITELIVGSCLHVDPIPHSFYSVTSPTTTTLTPSSSLHTRFKCVLLMLGILLKLWTLYMQCHGFKMYFLIMQVCH